MSEHMPVLTQAYSRGGPKILSHPPPPTDIQRLLTLHLEECSALLRHCRSQVGPAPMCFSIFLTLDAFVYLNIFSYFPSKSKQEQRGSHISYPLAGLHASHRGRGTCLFLPPFLRSLCFGELDCEEG